MLGRKLIKLFSQLLDSFVSILFDFVDGAFVSQYVVQLIEAVFVFLLDIFTLLLELVLHGLVLGT